MQNGYAHVTGPCNPYPSMFGSKIKNLPKIITINSQMTASVGITIRTRLQRPHLPHRPLLS